MMAMTMFRILANMNIDQEKIETILSQLGYNLTDRGSYWQTNAIYRDRIHAI